MAYAYRYIDPAQVSRVFLLGPSHHLYSRCCLLSQAEEYLSPIGSAPIDADVYQQLKSSGIFQMMDASTDEAEHSLELHLPYISYVMRQKAFTLVPIMVGAMNSDSEQQYAQILAPYLQDPRNVFVISSDFCHWGARFGFTFHDEAHGSISQSIEWLDREGMKLIEQADPQRFSQYIEQYSNTICGRHPIGVFLSMLQLSGLPARPRFVCYDQSSHCQGPRDSSVSYGAAILEQH